MRSNAAAVACVLLAGLAVDAAGQVVTPPPAPKPKEEYIPPSQRPAPEPTADPAGEPERNVRQITSSPEPKFDPSTVEFEPIYTVGEDGEIVGPDQPVEIASLTNNPLIGDDIRPIIEALLEERATEVEKLVAMNPRAAIDYALGVVDRMDFADTETISEVSRVAQALQVGDGAVVDLANQGVLTDQMRTMSVYIWQDYNTAVTTRLAEQYADSDEENALLNAQSRYLMDASMEEIGQAFDRLARGALAALDNPDAEAALALDGTEFRRAAGAILDRLTDERLAEVLRAGN